MGKVVDIADAIERRHWAAIIDRLRQERELIQSGRQFQLDATEQWPALRVVARNGAGSAA